MRNIVYFDLETMRSADEVGGWNHIDQMGMSIGVTYSTGNGGYSIYAESEVNQLQWSKTQPDWIAISFDKKLQILRV